MLAVIFDEQAGAEVRGLFGTMNRIYASNLLEAEVASVAAREGISGETISGALCQLDWVFPDRPLSREYESVLRAGRLRGADLWHLACALFLVGDPGQLPFITLDLSQAEVARKMGFQVLGAGAAKS